MSKVVSAVSAVEAIRDGAVVAVNSSSGLCCPDYILHALGERFKQQASPTGLTMIHPIAAGDMFGTKGIDHIAYEGLIDRVIGGSYPSGPSSAEPPLIWQLLSDNKIAAYNVPSGIVFDLMREAAAHKPGLLTRVGLDTYVDPEIDGCAMNDRARQHPIVKRIEFEGDTWLFFPVVSPNIAIIRATTADERGNLTFESEGAYLGAMELALAAHNCGGKVIAQVKRTAKAGSLKPHDVRVPGNLVDFVVEAPDQLQTTATDYDPAISGELIKPLDSFELPEFNVAKVIARRVALELKKGWAVNIGFGISANVPRIFLEEECHGDITWVIEQGAVGGIPLLDFKFGCSANAEAFVASPNQFTYFQAGGFDAALLSFLEIDQFGSVNVSRLPSCPHRTAGIGGFADITANASKIVFSGNFNAGAKQSIVDGQLKIEQEGKIAKFVNEVNHISFSGKRAVALGQDITYITERCVIKLENTGLVVTEVAPGIDIKRDIQDQAQCELKIADNVSVMSESLFKPEKMGSTFKKAILN